MKYRRSHKHCTLTYINCTSDKTGRTMKNHKTKSTKTTLYAHKKVNNLVHSVKDHLNLEGQGVYANTVKNGRRTLREKYTQTLTRTRNIGSEKKDNSLCLVTHTLQTGHNFNFNNKKFSLK